MWYRFSFNYQSLNYYFFFFELRKSQKKFLLAAPFYFQAQHNLCVVYVERGDLLKAETCLVKASQMDPQAQYIQVINYT